MENNTIINNNTRINRLTYSCKPLPHPALFHTINFKNIQNKCSSSKNIKTRECVGMAYTSNLGFECLGC